MGKLYVLLFGEQVVDQLGGADDDADHHEDHQHTHAHIAQAVHKTHQIKVKIHKFTPFLSGTYLR